MSFELVLCTDTLLREIADTTIDTKQIAMTYALAMKSSEPTDWPAVNKAIMARFGKAGLIKIKKAAHSGSCFK